MQYTRYISFVLLFAGTCAIFLSAPSSYAQTELENEREELQSELRELEQRIAEYENKLEKNRGEIATLQGQIAAINTQISKLNAEIRRTETQIESTQLTIQETETAIDEATSRIEEQKAVIAELLRSMYITGNDSLLEQLLRYNSLSDALTNIHSAAMVQEQLNDVLAETRVIRHNLEEQTVVLRQNERTLEEKTQELAVQRQAQSDQRTFKDTILKETQQEEARYKQLLSAAEQERADFLRRIVQIEQQIRTQQNFLSYARAGTIPPPGTKLFIWPQDNARLTQGYGHTAFARRGAYGGQGHNGIDMSAGLASPIRAAADGTVIGRGDRACTNYVNRACNGFWGNWIAIEHPGGLVTLYSHMSRPTHRAVGEKLSAGDIIGYEGATGNVTGSHLHFTVYTEFFTYKDPTTGETRFSYNFGKTLNPLDYL